MACLSVFQRSAALADETCTLGGMASTTALPMPCSTVCCRLPHACVTLAFRANPGVLTCVCRCYFQLLILRGSPHPTTATSPRYLFLPTSSSFSLWVAGGAAVHGDVDRRLPRQGAFRVVRVRLLRRAPGIQHKLGLGVLQCCGKNGAVVTTTSVCDCALAAWDDAFLWYPDGYNAEVV